MRGEFDPFDLTPRILAAIPHSRDNIVLSAQTYINLKNLATKKPEKEVKTEKANS